MKWVWIEPLIYTAVPLFYLFFVVFDLNFEDVTNSKQARPPKGIKWK